MERKDKRKTEDTGGIKNAGETKLVALNEMWEHTQKDLKNTKEWKEGRKYSGM